MNDQNFESICKRTIRVCGDVICDVCGNSGWKHPDFMGILTNDGLGKMIPFLKEGCDGNLWKF